MSQDNPYQPPKAQVADVAIGEGAELASRGARLGGAIIDGIIMLIIVFPAMFATDYWQKAMSGIQPTFFEQLPYALLGFLVYVAVNSYLLQKTGQTVGKRLAGTRIVSVDENRLVPLWKVLTVRQLPITVVAQVPFVGGLLSLVDCLLIFRGDKRCGHDLIAGTKVVQSSVPWKKLDE